MTKKKMNKRALMLLTMCVSAATALPAFAAGWTKSNDDWYYTDRDGNYVTNEWEASGNSQFYLGDDGKMLKNALIEDNGNYYYVNEQGARVKNEWHYLYDENEGEEY